MKEDRNTKNEINVNNGQAIFATGQATVYVTQNNNETNTIINDIRKKFQNNKKENYLKNWNSRLFLHIDNDERPIALADAFITPDYKKHKEVKRIGFSSGDILDEIIRRFIKYDRTSTMLLTGVPGIGKSSITSWIANEYKNNDDVIILRFRDWKVKELENGLLNAICNILCCEGEDLEDKILVLDGFDEMKLVNNNSSFVSDFFNEILDCSNLKIIITSRLNYIRISEFQNVFQIEPFNEDKIKRFFQVITGNKLDNKNIDKNNLDVLGIPVILYMAIVANMDLTMKASKPELYNRIFAENGGIFDKFPIKGVAYDDGSHPFKDRINKKIYLEFLQEVAFEMFEKNDLSLSKKEYQIPEIKFQRHHMRVLEFPMKYLFENVEANIEFIHKSIYEYFVSEYIFTSINNVINDKELIKNLANVLGCMLKSNYLSPEILEFLKYKIRYNKYDIKLDIINKTFQNMLQDGMTYYMEDKCKNVLKCEINIFKNMLEILHCCKICVLGSNALIYYINHSKEHGLKLIGVNLEGADFEGLDLREANLREANLSNAYLSNVDLSNAYLNNADLSNAYLSKVNLSKTDLSNAYLSRANLSNADLSRADLSNTNLSRADLSRADLSNADLREANLSRVDLSRANLSNADLSRADLSNADLSNADLSNADLNNTYLFNANLSRANLSNAYLFNANLEQSIWIKDDIKSTLSLLKETKFSYIYVIEWRKREKKKIYREELFPYEE